VAGRSALLRSRYDGSSRLRCVASIGIALRTRVGGAIRAPPVGFFASDTRGRTRTVVSSIGARHPLRSASHADIMDPHCESVAEPREASRSGLRVWVAPSGRPHNDSFANVCARRSAAIVSVERRCSTLVEVEAGRSAPSLTLCLRFANGRVKH